MKLEEDKLNRAQILNKLFKIFNNFSDLNDKGLTLILNGKYGSGKSTVFDFLEERCSSATLKDSYNVLRYDAWKNNIFDNPIIPILYKISELQTTENNLIEYAQNIIKNIPGFVVQQFLQRNAGINIECFKKQRDIFEEIKTYNNSIQDFRNLLKTECKTKKIIFLVDELDRCLPEYQIKVLESLYHFLDIPNLIVLIAIDRTLLDDSVKKVFGNELDTYAYLAKFVDYQIELPMEETYYYINQLHKANYDKKDGVIKTISGMLKCIDLPIRECQKIIDELNLICSSENYSMFWCPIIITFLLICKYNNNSLFKKHIKQRKSRYHVRNIVFKDSKYMRFVKDISGARIETVLNYLKEDNIGKFALVNLISLFDSLKLLNKNEIVDYISKNEEVSLIEHIQNISSEDIVYTQIQNEIIEKIKVLN